MGFFDTLRGKKQPTYAQRNVVIPEHQKQKIEEAMEKNARRKPRRVAPERHKQKIVYAGEPPEFEISGVFAVGGLSMIKGRVIQGRIKPKSRILRNKKKYAVKEIRVGSAMVDVLLEGDEGTLFLNDLKKIPFKNGDIIQFE